MIKYLGVLDAVEGGLRIVEMALERDSVRVISVQAKVSRSPPDERTVCGNRTLTR
jgi:hypothetical protein